MPDRKRRIEADVYKLLGSQPKNPTRSKALLDEFFSTPRIRRTTAARMICAADADDPRRCAAEIPDKPRASEAKSERGYFQGEIEWTKPRDKPKDAPPAPPPPPRPASAPSARTSKPTSAPSKAETADARQVRIEALLRNAGFGQTSKNGDWFLPGFPKYAFRLKKGKLTSGSLDEKRDFKPFDENIGDAEAYIKWMLKEADSEMEATLLSGGYSRPASTFLSRAEKAAAPSPEPPEPQQEALPVVEAPPETEADLLASHGLRLSEKMTTPTRPGKAPRPVWEVTGDTAAYAPLLSELGGSQRFRRGTYTFWSDPRQSLLAALRSQGRPTIEARELHEREKAAMRAEKHAARAEAAAERSAEARSKVRKIGDLIPLGQPIHIGHHSERRARKDAERIEAGMRKSIAEHEKAAESKRLASVNERRAEQEKPVDYWVRKRKDVDALIRKYERDLQHPNVREADRAHMASRLPLLRADREGLDAKIEALGGVKYDASNLIEGHEVLWHGQWFPVLRTNPKTVTIGRWLRLGLSSSYKIPYEEIKGQRAAELSVDKIDVAASEAARQIVRELDDLRTLEKIDDAYLDRHANGPEAEDRKARRKQTDAQRRDALARLLSVVKVGDRVSAANGVWSVVTARNEDGFMPSGGKLRPWSELYSHEPAR